MNTATKESSLKATCLERAKLVGDWCIANQIKDKFQPNYGEFMANYHPEKLFFNGKNTLPSGGMMTAMGANFLLMLADRTGEAKYYDAAIRCGEFLKSLQYLYHGKPELYGCVGEFSLQQLGPRAEGFCYRSTTVVGDAFVLLYAQTGDHEYLDRAKLIADWFIKYALADEGWVVDNDKRPNVLNIRYYFQMANVLFFYHLSKYVQDAKYVRVMREMSEYYLKNFYRKEGLMKMVLDEEAFQKHLGNNDFSRRWWRMHMYNDDFSHVALLAAASYFNDPRYRQAAEVYGKWLLKEQNEDGSLGEPSVWVGSATAPILWQDLYLATGDDNYVEATRKALTHLITLQELDPGDTRTFGAIYANNEIEGAVCARTCNYGPVALLKYDGKVAGPYLSAFDQNGKYYLGFNGCNMVSQ
jgi:hypothetical protein